MTKVSDFPLILPCGGQSERMGMLKGLLDYHGEPWLLAQMRKFRESGGQKVIVVLGFEAATYLKKIPLLQNASGPFLTVETNDLPHLGPFSSLQCGAKQVLKGFAA